MNEVIQIDFGYLQRDFAAAISEIEQFLATLPQTEIPVKHQFCDGLYVREGMAPAGTVVVTRVHKHDNVAFITKGLCVVCEDGKTFELEAPAVHITKAGTKRLLYAVDDVIWTTVHAMPPGMDEQTPVKEIEAHFACNTLEEYQQYLSEVKP